MDRVIARVPGERSRQDDLADAGHARRDRRHEHARRVPRLSAGCVDSRPRRPDGRGPRKRRSVAVLEAEAVLALALVEGANASGGELERMARVGGKALEGVPPGYSA